MDDSEWLFRYRQFYELPDARAEEPEQILLCSQLWASSPADFNDPFDCVPCVSPSALSVDDQLAFVHSLLRRRDIAPESPQGRELLRAAATGALGSEAYRAHTERRVREVLQECSVCCFSYDRHDLRMWGQYAHGHRGYCVAYLLEGEWPEDTVPIPVRYERVRPTVLPFGSPSWDDIEAAVFTKSQQWMGEEEVRIFRPGCSAGLFTVPKTALRVVFLGIWISESNRRRILDVNAQRARPAAIVQCRAHPAEYRIVEEIVTRPPDDDNVTRRLLGL